MALYGGCDPRVGGELATMLLHTTKSENAKGVNHIAIVYGGFTDPHGEETVHYIGVKYLTSQAKLPCPSRSFTFCVNRFSEVLLLTFLSKILENDNSKRSENICIGHTAKRHSC